MRQTTEIINQIHGMKRELYEKFHVSRIGIFGSFSQGHQTEKSDLDLVVEFERPIGIMAFVHLKDQITEQIGIQVDLVTPDGLHPLIRNAVMREVIYVWKAPYLAPSLWYSWID
jgi:predicted nucleotidyltransferase